MSDPLALDELVADLYREASLRGADMRAFAGDVESLVRALREPESLAAPWKAVNAMIAARHPDSLHTELLVSLREGVVRLQLDAHRAHIDRVARTSPADAEGAWVALLGEATAELWAVVIREVGEWADDRPFLDHGLGRCGRDASAHLDARRYADTWPLLDRLAHDDRIGAPVRADLLALLGQIAVFRMDDVPAWQDVFAEAQEIDRDDPRLLMAQADLEAKRSEWATTDEGRVVHLDEADRLLETADASSRLRPDDHGLVLERWGDLRVKRATHAQRSGRPDQVDKEWARAQELYRSAISVAPWAVSHVSSLIAQLVRAGAPADDGEVVRLVDLVHLIEPTPTGTIAETAIAAGLFESGRTDDARDAFRQVLDRDPANIDAIEAYGALLLAAGQDAPGWLAGAEERSPGTFEVAQAQAWIAESQGRYDDAEAHYLTALERRPRAEPAIRADLAWVYQQRGDTAAAAAEAVTACALLVERQDRDSPAIVPATARLLDASDRLLDGGELDEALGHLDTVLSLRGPSFAVEHRNRRGVAFFAARRLDEAIEEYRRAIELDERAAVVWENLGLALRIANDLDGARDAVEHAFSLNGDTAARDAALAAIANIRGNTAAAANDYGAAIASYRDAVALAPDDPVILANLAAALLEQADDDTISAHLDEAVALLERSTANGGAYEEHLRWARRGQEVADLLGGFVLTARSPARVRVHLPEGLVPVFADGTGTLAPSVSARLGQLSGDVGYGIKGASVLLSRGSTTGPSTARLTLNGQTWTEVEVHGDAEPVLSAVERAFSERPDAFIGPDETAAVVAGSDRADLAERLDDPDRFVALIRDLRLGAGPGARLDDAVGAPVGEP